MAFTGVWISFLLATIMALQYLVHSQCDEFTCNCCVEGHEPLPALSEEEIQARETAHSLIVNFTRSISVDKPNDVSSVHPSYLNAVCPLVFNFDLLQSLNTKDVYPHLNSFGTIVNSSVCQLLLGHNCTQPEHHRKLREYCLSSTLETISEEFVSTTTKPCISRVKYTNGSDVKLQHRCQQFHRLTWCVFYKLSRDTHCDTTCIDSCGN